MSNDVPYQIKVEIKPQPWNARFASDDEEASDETLMLYPNPAGGFVNVGFITTSESSASVTVSDMLGRSVLQEEHTIAEGLNTISVDISRLQPGCYFVTVVQNEALLAERLMVR